MPELLTGRPAPDFALTDTHGLTVRLSDYLRQNVVLVFNRSFT